MLFFIRHGQSEANAAHVFAGSENDSPLTALGRAQARAAAEQLLAEKIHLDHIISSPLIRSLESARIIAQTIGFDPNKIIIDSRIREYEDGSLSGSSTHNVSSADLVNAPGAEPPKHFLARVVAALNDYSDSTGNTLLVSHAGVGRMIEVNRNRLDPSGFYDLPEPKNAELIKL